MTPADSKFFDNTERLPWSGCWVWMGSVNAKGYGRSWNNGRIMPAHRKSLEFRGVSVPQGMVVDHLCKVPSCVNPDHLRVVTHRQNSVVNSNSVTAINAAKETCPRGHKYDFVKRRKDGTTHRDCMACKNEWQRNYRAKHG